MAKQEILPPGRDATNATSRREIQLIDDSVSNLKGRINLIDRMRVGLQSGKKTAEVILAMQTDVLQAQRDVVQHHAQMIARERKMQITDAFQAGIAGLTRRVDERVTVETKYFWTKLYERVDYYEEFFETKIREIEAKATSGALSPERAEARIRQCEADRDKQIEHDRMLLDDLLDATAKVLRRALEDYQPD